LKSSPLKIEQKATNLAQNKAPSPEKPPQNEATKQDQSPALNKQGAKAPNQEPIKNEATYSSKFL